MSTFESIDIKDYLKYARKHGLRHLQLLLPCLKNWKAIEVCGSACQAYEQELRLNRAKNTGKYKK